MGILDWFTSILDDSEEAEMQKAKVAVKAAAKAGAAKKALEKEPKKKEKQQHTWQHPNEMIKFVCMGARTMCPYCIAPGTIMVTSTQVKLQDKFWATSADRNGAPVPNILFPGICMHPRWGITPPMCPTVIQLGQWENVSKTIIDIYPALLRKSTIKCLHSGQDIIIIHSGQKALIEAVEPQTTPPKPAPPGHYYTKDGIFLGKILHHEDVYITDEGTFESMKNKGPWSEGNVIAFTEKYNMTNTELLNRANWIYAEGGYKIPEYYAYTMENAFNHSGIGNKKEKMLYYWLMQEVQTVKVTKEDGTVKDETKTVRLEKNLYFSGGYKNQTGKAFWSKRDDPKKFDTDMIDCMRSIIKSKLRPESDPTGGTNGWLGYNDKKAHTGEFYIASLGGRHFFYIAGKSKPTLTEKEYTIKE